MVGMQKMRVYLDNCCFNRPFGGMMFTDTQIKTVGFRALVAALGDVQAEKFIALIQREPFDYTQWQRTLWTEKGVEEISQAAMKHRRADQSPENKV